MEAILAIGVYCVWTFFLYWILKHAYDAILDFLKLADRAVTAFERFVDMQAENR